jgi:hypothetical protein
VALASSYSRGCWYRESMAMIDQDGNVIPGTEIDYAVVMSGLAVLSRQVKETWLKEDYPKEVQSDTAQFRHACLHAIKALGKISALIDHADHERLADKEAVELRKELPKLLSDIIRCTAKMAETAPSQPVALAISYIERAKQLATRWGH